MVNKFQPQAVQFSDSGPDIRWVGNERGYAYEKMWSPLNRDEIYPGYPKFDDYRQGQENGKYWVAPEVDVSIRPGWYYHPEQDDKVKSPDSLMKIYVASVGRNANLLLNIPVDTRGLIHPNDSASMIGFKQLRDKGLLNLYRSSDKIRASSSAKGNSISKIIDTDKRSFWAAEAKDSQATITYVPQMPLRMNAILLQEPIQLGQRVKRFDVLLTDENGQEEIIAGYTIGNKRILAFSERKIKSIQVKFLDARGQVLISNFELLRITSLRNEPLYQ
jgi:alpha-L-fucosidase